MSYHSDGHIKSLKNRHRRCGWLIRLRTRGVAGSRILTWRCFQVGMLRNAKSVTVPIELSRGLGNFSSNAPIEIPPTFNCRQRKANASELPSSARHNLALPGCAMLQVCARVQVLALNLRLPLRLLRRSLAKIANCRARYSAPARPATVHVCPVRPMRRFPSPRSRRRHGWWTGGER